MFGYLVLRLRAMIARSFCSVCACAGKAPRLLGPAIACLSQQTCTWLGVTPAFDSRLLTVVHVAAPGLSHAVASWPPCAPSTMMSCGFFAGSVSARALKLPVPALANSCVVFDMPTEIMTILPAA